MPLYAAGLCDAVSIAPGASSRPAAKYSRSVDASPRCDDVDALRRTPSAKAAGELDAGRPHVVRDQDARGGLAKRANAAPIARDDRRASS